MSSSKTIFYKELHNIKQTHVNNGFPNSVIDQQIKMYLNKVNNTTNKIDNINNNTVRQNKHNTINLYYCNQMHNNYK